MSETDPLPAITALMVNYGTLDLTTRCVESFVSHYPSVRLVLVDNGSHDASTDYLKHVGAHWPQVTCILNPGNLYHGPAMDQGIRQSATRYVFTLDSDCEVLRGGFLELMVASFSDPQLYAVGPVTLKNRYGFEVQRGMVPYVRYAHPHATLLDKDKYLQLHPFIHHGAPCLKNMRDAERHGFRVQNFPIQEYICHVGKGTCSRFGYGLGPMTLVQYYLSEYIPTRLARFGFRWPGAQ